MHVFHNALSCFLKVDVPLQVGEPLSVDCSFGSAGGHSVVSTAAAGTRHRHPWLFQLSCGEGGRLEAEQEKAQSLKAFEVQLVSSTTGACEHSLRASFPARRIRCDGRAGAGEEEEQPTTASNGGSAAGVGERRNAHMDELEQHISRLQHSVFWEEVFETIKAEALVDGKDGWLAHPDARSGSDTAGNRNASGGIARIEAGSKRRLVSFTSRGTANVARNAGVRVVHVMDDEVMVELDNKHLLGYRLLSSETGPHESKEGPAASVACTKGGVSADEGISEGPGGENLVSLCQLALLYCGSLIRQRQQTQADAESPPGSDAQSGREVGARVAATAAESGARDGTREGHSSATSTWKSVGRVLLHHVFRTEVSNTAVSQGCVGNKRGNRRNCASDKPFQFLCDLPVLTISKLRACKSMPRDTNFTCLRDLCFYFGQVDAPYMVPTPDTFYCCT